MNTLPSTRFATSNDGTRIAYEVHGHGPTPLVLLHGGGQSRQVWRGTGYLERLTPGFTVVAIDLRGHGDSGKPAMPEGHAVARHCEDVLAVAGQLGIADFALMGYSLGANVGRYLASASPDGPAGPCNSGPRLVRFVMIGIPFGPGASGASRETLVGVCARWLPLLGAQAEGRLDPATLSPPERAYLDSGRAAAELPWLIALLGWGSVMPGDLRCPTLWVVGGQNAPALESTRACAAELPASPVQLALIEGLGHDEELSAVDRVWPRIQPFLAPAPA